MCNNVLVGFEEAVFGSSQLLLMRLAMSLCFGNLCDNV